MLSELRGSEGRTRLINYYEDAGVLKIDDRRQIVQSIDVIAPVADDAATVGAKAAAHALSDLYTIFSTSL